MASDRLKRQIDRLLDEAEQAIARRDWGAVRDRARDVLAIDPDNNEGRAFLAAAERALESATAPAPGQALEPAPPALSGAITPTSLAQPTAPSTELRTSFANGRYEVKQFLGEGGKKRVYLAHDTVLDRDVAFALIKTEGLDEAARQRISREARAMGRLGDHPHIMPIHDLGQEGGRPYMVLPLMGGGDVESLIEQAPDHRLPLHRVLEIAQQVCRGLAFAHSKGIIHRDLKPGNVWLTADGTAKIGDFGLALPLDRPRLTQEGMMVGTVDYMPPEQALGGEVTPRADLYSLGCMVYEMVTGRPPFMGDDPVAIIGQHINTPPVAPTWHNGQCPRPLEALVLRLLAKDPAERPGSAADVLAALEALDLEDVGAQHAAPLQDEGHVLDSLAGGVFVGRQREMGELKAALEDALSGRGRLVTLVGEPGIGKTRTAQELATYAGLRQCQVLWGRCYEGQGAPPYWPWVQAIRSYVRDREEQQLRSDMGAGAADIAEVVSDVRERLPDLKPPPVLEPEQARFRLFDSITVFLRSASRRQPLVLVLEDLHWADRPSLLLLEFLARELANSRLLVIGTYRDVEVSRRHPLCQTLGELTRERLFQRVLLRGLSEEDVGRFIELVSGLTPPRGLVEAVYRQTEGNPLFVTEVVRLLVQEGELTPDVGSALRGRPGHPHRGAPTEPGRSPPQRDSWTVRIPEGVREVIGRRLDRLSERCNQTLTIASVIGREFTLEQLKPLNEDMTEDRLLEVLEEALAARVIEELPRAVGRYQFTHALIQETLVEELTTTRRVRLHARIAEMLEELYGATAEARAAELAHHFAEAQTVLGTEKLVRYSLLAGERALAAYAWEEALAHFQRALVAKGVSLTGKEPPPDAEAAALLFGLGQAQAATYERPDAARVVDTLSRAFYYYVGVGDSGRTTDIAAHPQFPPNLAGEIIAKALELVPPDSHEAGRLLNRRIRDLRGDYERAQDAFHRALAIAQREGDLDLEMQTLVAAACVDFTAAQFEQSLERNLQAIELAKRVDHPVEEAHARYDLMHVLYAMGDLEGAARHATAMFAPAERLGTRRQQANAMDINEIVCSAKGDWTTGRSFSDRGLEMSPRDTNLLGSRAVLEYQVGDFDAGEAFVGRMVETVQQGRSWPPSPFSMETLTVTFPAVVIPLVARITGATARFDVAEAMARSILAMPAVAPAVWQAARIGLALIAVQRSDRVEAAELYAFLGSVRGTMSPQSPHGPGLAGDRTLGLLAHTMGQFDKAAEHFEDALAFCRKAGYRPELAWTCCDYADCLLARAQLSAHGEPVEGRGSTSPDSSGSRQSRDSPRTEPQQDRPRARSLLDEALAISRELGMRPLMERVLSRREILTA